MSFQKLIVGLFLGIGCLMFRYTYAQKQQVADSLAKIYQNTNPKDTQRLQLLANLSFNEVNDFELSLRYAEELIREATVAGNNLYLCKGYFQKGNKKRILGDLPEALDAYFKCVQVAGKSNYIRGEANAYAGIGDVYGISKRHAESIVYYDKAIATLLSLGDSIQVASVILNAGEEFRTNKIYDSAVLYNNRARLIFEKKGYPAGTAYAIGNTGMVYADMGNYNLAEKNITTAISLLEKSEDYYPICDYLLFMGNIYLEKKDRATALSYDLKSLDLARQHHLKEEIRDANSNLSDLYAGDGDYEKSLSHFKEYIKYRDSVEDIKTIRQTAELRIAFEVSRKQAEVNLLNRQKAWQFFLLVLALIVLAVIAVLVIILFRSNRQKQKAYALLSQEKLVTEEQRDQTNKALEKLKRAQAHLVQSEKLASLGQLTAGIAHEIQNPLNFVNNFSEVNAELIAELQEENRKGNVEAVHAIALEIHSNELKISQHGRRADGIVKGMMQHSRPGERVKKSTDINSLVNEYFRLAYLGQKAKDKSFDVAMHTDFDLKAGEIDIIPHEIGRVIINLVNNAFYAVSDKITAMGNSFQPTVTVSTKRVNNQVFISIKDNGTGIPGLVKGKIFQPFFTTKAPGVGTGLGLSLSYDIIKAHGGEIKVESEEGKGSEFIIMLPAENEES